MAFRLQSDMGESDAAEFPDCRSAARCHNIIVGFVLLKHEPHGTDIVSRVPPIALGIEIPKLQFVGKSKFDPRHAVRDLSCHKFDSPQGALMVKENARNWRASRSSHDN